MRTARLSRELCGSDFVKVEVIPDAKYLLPDNYATVKATEILAKEGFVVMPYMYPDLNVAKALRDAGAAWHHAPWRARSDPTKGSARKILSRS